MTANVVIDILNNHTSIRKFDQNFIMPRAHVDLIVQAGQRASTSASLQMYTIIEIPKEMRTEMIQPCGGQQFIRDASFFCIIFVDLHRIKRMVQLSGEEPDPVLIIPLTMGVFDAGIMAQNMVIAAESLGYGICYCGACGDSYESQKEILNLPEHLIPITGLAIGKSIENPPKRPRYSQKMIHHISKYSDCTDEELEEEMNHMSVELTRINNREVDWKNRLNERFTKGWARNRENKRIDTLKKQGFQL